MIMTLMGRIAWARPATTLVPDIVKPSKAPSSIGSADPKTQPQKLAQKAVTGDPTQTDYLTLLAWIRALGGGAAVGVAIATMSTVLEEDPSNERALLYRGKLRMIGSRADFKATPDGVVQQFITGRATGPFEL